MSSNRFDLLCDFVNLLITAITTILSELQHYTRQRSPIASRHNQLARLQAEHSALLLQRDNLSRQIATLEALMLTVDQTLTEANLPQRPVPDQPTSSSHILQVPRTRPTPPRTPTRRRTHRSSIGIPYPLPCTPPRTPEEQRRNNIIEWINELRSKNPP